MKTIKIGYKDIDAVEINIPKNIWKIIKSYPNKLNYSLISYLCNVLQKKNLNIARIYRCGVI